MTARTLHSGVISIGHLSRCGRRGLAATQQVILWVVQQSCHAAGVTMRRPLALAAQAVREAERLMAAEDRVYGNKSEDDE